MTVFGVPKMEKELKGRAGRNAFIIQGEEARDTVTVDRIRNK